MNTNKLLITTFAFLITFASSGLHAWEKGYDILEVSTVGKAHVLFAYDRDTGRAHKYLLTRHGIGSRQSDKEFKWRKSWTHMIFPPNKSLRMFHSRTTGDVQLYKEGNWGYTFQKQTFNNCKDVTVHAVNKTGKEIKVIDVDYYDYYKKVWRSEPTPNRKISANGKPYIWKFNLNQVDHAYTQIRVKYRKKEGNGWTSKVYRDWSSKSICEKGKKYRVNLEL